MQLDTVSIPLFQKQINDMLFQNPNAIEIWLNSKKERKQPIDFPLLLVSTAYFLKELIIQWNLNRQQSSVNFCI